MLSMFVHVIGFALLACASWLGGGVLPKFYSTKEATNVKMQSVSGLTVHSAGCCSQNCDLRLLLLTRLLCLLSEV